MKTSITLLALIAGLALPMSTAYAAEGAATGNGTSTPAGPAGDNAGPSKSGSMSSQSKDGMTKSPSMATGAGQNQPTATGGQPGGSPSKN